MEDEMRKDLDALARVRKMIEAKQPALQKQANAPKHKAPAVTPDVGEPEEEGAVKGTTIRGAIEALINSDPNVRWTKTTVLKKLQSESFRIGANNPMWSVGTALGILAKMGRIRVVKKGQGSEPNIYKGKLQDQFSRTVEEPIQTSLEEQQ